MHKCHKEGDGKCAQQRCLLFVVVIDIFFHRSSAKHNFPAGTLFFNYFPLILSLGDAGDLLPILVPLGMTAGKRLRTKTRKRSLRTKKSRKR